MSPLPSGNPKQPLVDAVVDASSPDAALQAVTALVIACGVAVDDGSGGEVPPGGLMVPLQQLRVLATEGRSRRHAGHLTPWDLSDIFSQLGVPIPSGPVGIRDYLATWVQSAAANSDDPASVPPLVLAALAARQEPPIDLSDASYSPQDLRFTMLDVVVLTAGIAQLAPVFAAWLATPTPPTPPAPVPTPPPAGASVAAANGFAPTSSASMPGPCTALQDSLNRWTPMFGSSFMTTTGAALRHSLAEAAKDFAEDILKLTRADLDNPVKAEVAHAAGQAFEAVAAALGLFAKILTLVAFYQHRTASVELTGGDPVHQPAPGQTVTRGVVVTAGIPDDEWAAIQQGHGDSIPAGLLDCLKALGFNWHSQLDQLTEEAIAKWQVQYRLQGSLVNYGDISQYDFPGTFTCLIKPTSDHAGASQVNLAILPQTPVADPHKTVTFPVRVVAEVTFDDPPDFSKVDELAAETVFTGGNAVVSLANAGHFAVSWLQRMLSKPLTVWIHVQQDVAADLMLFYQGTYRFSSDCAPCWDSTQWWDYIKQDFAFSWVAHAGFSETGDHTGSGALAYEIAESNYTKGYTVSSGVPGDEHKCEVTGTLVRTVNGTFEVVSLIPVPSINPAEPADFQLQFALRDATEQTHMTDSCQPGLPDQVSQDVIGYFANIHDALAAGQGGSAPGLTRLDPATTDVYQLSQWHLDPNFDPQHGGRIASTELRYTATFFDATSRGEEFSLETFDIYYLPKSPQL